MLVLSEPARIDSTATLPEPHPNLDTPDADRVEETMQLLSAASLQLNILGRRSDPDTLDLADGARELVCRSIAMLRELGTGAPAAGRPALRLLGGDPVA